MNEQKLIRTENPDFFLRKATVEDSAVVAEYMRRLGIYQKTESSVTCKPEGIRQVIESGRGESYLGVYDGEIVSMVYFCENSSAFIGASGIYVDGLYIDEEYRGRGLGRIYMGFLSKIATERGHKRLEWGCIDWNAPAIKFYNEMGAKCVDVMRIYRFSEEVLHKTAENFFTLPTAPEA